MLYVKRTAGAVADIVSKLAEASKARRFGVLAFIDLKAKMVEKGVPFDRECVIVEVCNPGQAKKVLDEQPLVSTSLPCRISAYEDAGEVAVATVRPTILLSMYENAESLADVARQVEDAIIGIIDDACQETGVSHG